MTTEIFNQYPQINSCLVDSLLQNEIDKNQTKLVVLDDDPTGVQTVHDVLVCTDWSVESIIKGLTNPCRVFYILTNSRGMTAEETTAVHRQIVHNVSQAAKETGIKYLYMSRSDSTLRGHYPLEPALLKEGLETEENLCVDGEVLCPFFPEGGRYTIGNIHYVKYGEKLIPAAETEFAGDKSFGYTKSAIPDYIEEKTKGAYKAEDVLCISLEMIRSLDIDAIESKLLQVTGFHKICVNAIDYTDLKVFCIALYRAMSKGKTFMFRTAAGLVKVLGGISDRPLLTRKEMILKNTDHGGLVVIGSHTQKTTEQLECLLFSPNIVAIPFHSDLVLSEDEVFEKEIERCVALESEAISSGKTAVCYTERKYLSLENDTQESALLRSVKISRGVQNLVGRLMTEPSFIIAKGGITSSDIGTKALHVKYANVMGQICPGIPVWQTDENSKFPNIPYVIFPGNVGDADSLLRAVQILSQQ